jgi:hypothetical protein
MTTRWPLDTAHHEAGHAVVRFLLGRACVYVSVIPDDPRFPGAAKEGGAAGRLLPVTLGFDGKPAARPQYPDRERVALEDEVVVALSGPIAEARYQGSSFTPLEDPQGPNELAVMMSLPSDIRKAIDRARLLTDAGCATSVNDCLRELARRATHLVVTEGWPAIEAVAEMLAREGSAHGLEVEAAIYEVGLPTTT